MNFDEVYKEHARTVMKYLLKATNDSELSEELMQETFLIAFKKLDTFRGECKLSVWLCQIAKNLLFDYLRKNKGFLKKDLEENIDGQAEKGPGTEKKVESRAQYLYLLSKVHELPEPYREVFLLRYSEEITLKEIAELFHKSESWARVTYYRAREQLKEMLKGEGYGDFM